MSRWWWESWKVWPFGVVNAYGAVYGVVGVARPSSRSAAMVMIFPVDPGSNTADAAREPRSRRCRGARIVGIDRARVGEDVHLAGLDVHDTMTEPHSAPVAATCWSRRFCTYHWRSLSMVVTRVLPGTAALSVCTPVGMTTVRPALVSMVSEPDWPRS